jgi:hypothetical protein
MADQQTGNLSFSASIGAVCAKLITTLVVIALLVGIAAESISLLTGFYNLRKARCDAAMSAVEVAAKGRPMSEVGKPSSVQSFVSACIY